MARALDAARLDDLRSLPRIAQVFVVPHMGVRRLVRTYPVECRLRTPMGVVAPTLYSHHDLWTVKQVFVSLDYPMRRGAKVIVDIGSNIGITALWWLTRSPDTHCYLFEPDPRNAQRLRHNVDRFADRYELIEAAVADRSGQVAFGREATGRYGAIDLDSASVIKVPCLHIDEVLTDVLAREHRIDILKLDTEGFEQQTIAAIDPDLLACVGAIYFETAEPFNPAPGLFTMSYASTCRLVNRDLAMR